MDSSLVYDCPRMKSRKNPAPDRKKARRSEIAGPQTVDNPSPMRRCTDSHGETVKRGRESPLHVQSMQKWELFRKFPFSRLKLSTLCRQLEARRFQIAWPQTVDNPSPMRRCSDSHGEIVKRGRDSPLHVQSMQKWELFGSSHFCVSSCRHSVDSLRWRCFFTPR